MNTVQSLKLKYGKLYKLITPISKQTIYFRLISKKEFNTYVNLANSHINITAEDYLLEIAVVEPNIKDLEPILFSGEYRTIADAILSKCGFAGEENREFTEELKHNRILTQNLLMEQIIALICKAFPIYKVHEIEDMNYVELSRLLALSESILGIQLNIPGAEVEDPNKKPVKKSPEEMTPEEKLRIEKTRDDALKILKDNRSRRPQ